MPPPRSPANGVNGVNALATNDLLFIYNILSPQTGLIQEHELGSGSGNLNLVWTESCTLITKKLGVKKL